jgi:hypothetical protein
MDLKRKQFLYKKYRYLLKKNTEDIDKKHLIDFHGGKTLRCFHYRKEKTDEEIKIYRCPTACKPGSIFCGKHDFDRALTEVKKKELPRVYKNELHNLLQTYLDEPSILDHKQDLAILRTMLTGYVNKLSSPDKIGVSGFLARLRNILNTDTYYTTDALKYEGVMDTFYDHQDLFSDKSIRNINDTVKNIGTAIERINKVNVGDQFLMTPEGLSVFLRAMIEIMKNHITDKDVMLQIQSELMTISVATKGNLQMVNDNYLRKNDESVRSNTSKDV